MKGLLKGIFSDIGWALLCVDGSRTGVRSQQRGQINNLGCRGGSSVAGLPSYDRLAEDLTSSRGECLERYRADSEHRAAGTWGGRSEGWDRMSIPLPLGGKRFPQLHQSHAFRWGE